MGIFLYVADFRLLMTMNPVHGELSPAMRNRGVEIFVSPSPDQSKQVWPLKHFYLFALGK